jgi:glycosyltransferase involved in cell wall biosynthesis
MFWEGSLPAAAAVNASRQPGGSPAGERVTVIIPTLNEAESIGAVIASLPRQIVDQIIVADGGSNDGTPAIARDAGAGVVAIGSGYGRACLAAAETASNSEILVFMDGDGADDPSAVSEMIAVLRDDLADFVVGSRVTGKRDPSSMGWHQVFAGLLMGSLTRLLYGVRYTDMCALRAIRRHVLLQLGMRERTYGWNLEMQMRAARAGLRIKEVPVSYRRRSGGRSKVAGNFRGTVKATARILITFVRVALNADRA